MKIFILFTNLLLRDIFLIVLIKFLSYLLILVEYLNIYKLENKNKNNCFIINDYY